MPSIVERLEMVKIVIPATLVVSFVVYRQVGKKSHGTETSCVLMFFSHMQSCTPAPNFNNVPWEAAELATVYIDDNKR